MLEVQIKYYLKDRVWLISDNKAVEKMITQFDIVVDGTYDNPEVKVTYGLNYESENIDENKLFTSKEELLKSL